MQDDQSTFQFILAKFYNRRRGTVTVLGWAVIIVCVIFAFNWIYSAGHAVPGSKFHQKAPSIDEQSHRVAEVDKNVDEMDEMVEPKVVVTRPLPRKDLSRARKKLDEMMARLKKERQDNADEEAVHPKKVAPVRDNTISSLDDSFAMPVFDAEKERRLGSFKHPNPRARHPKPEPKKFPVKILETPWKVVDECPKGLLTLVILHSQPMMAGRRRAIRETWGKQTTQKYPKITPNKWRTIFVMGNEAHSQIDVKTENAQHGDILQGNFMDSPYEDTRKFLLGLRWLSEHMIINKCDPQFVIKSMDNTYHNMMAVTAWLEFKLGDVVDDLYMGNLLRQDAPIRDQLDPLYVPKNDYSRSFFPDLIKGPTYLFSLKTYLGLQNAVKLQTPIAMEDAYIGLLANKMRVLPTHNDHFLLLGKMSNVCNYLSAFFVHDVSASDQLQIWKVVKTDHKKICKDAHFVGGNRSRKLET